MLIVSPEFKCSNEMLTIVAMLSGISLITICYQFMINHSPLQFLVFGSGLTINGRGRMPRRHYSPFPTATISL